MDTRAAVNKVQMALESMVSTLEELIRILDSIDWELDNM